MHTRRSSAAALAAVAVLAAVAALLTAAGPQAGATTVDPLIAGDQAAGWVAGAVNAQGFVPGPGNAPNVSGTLQTALDLALNATDQADFQAIMAWIVANPEAAIAPDGYDSPGNLGYLLMLARAAGLDPHALGGVDLVARLGGTLQPSGLYGTSDPTYDGVFRQSVALLGLRSVGATPPAAAVTWLRGQQCTGNPAAAAGGFEAYRADPAVACSAPDPNAFTGPDTNSTAMAVMALHGLAGWTGEAAALDFLAAAQPGTGGMAYYTGGAADPNSTALAVLAVREAGEDPGAGRWVVGGTSLVASLLGWEVDCAAVPADCGALASPYSNGAGDAFATWQGAWALSGEDLLVTAATVFPQATTTTTTSTTTTSTTSTSSTTSTTTASTTTVTPVTVAATPVAATPALTG